MERFYALSPAFQSTLPARGATFSEEEKHEDSDISIHAPRTGSDPNPSQTHWRPCISIHAPRTGSDARAKAVAITSAIFQSTLPARGATEYSSHRSMLRLFQSTLPARGATMSCHLPVFGSRFQSTLPARGATSVMEAMLPPSMHFNPRSPHGERPRTGTSPDNWTCISIHAPRTGSDVLPAVTVKVHQGYFNPRSPHGERRYGLEYRFEDGIVISIHAPRTGSDAIKSGVFAPLRISIHAPRTGSDIAMLPITRGVVKFQSTLPARGATLFLHCRTSLFPFQSTLPARGATVRAMKKYREKEDFNPRSPHGERPWQDWQNEPDKAFQSTLPARGATAISNAELPVIVAFQSTLPARGATRPRDILELFFTHFNPRSPHGERLARETQWTRAKHFNPRSPHGERLPKVILSTEYVDISIHAPRTGSDLRLHRYPGCSLISIHAPRTGSDVSISRIFMCVLVFQSTLPARGATAVADCKRNRRLYFNPRSPHGERRGTR